MPKTINLQRLHSEFNVKTIAELVGHKRARDFTKWPKLLTWISTLCKHYPVSCKAYGLTERRKSTINTL